MTKKDYILLAIAFSETYPKNSSLFEQWAKDVYKIADVLKADNPRFDRPRFVSACLPTETLR